MTKQELLYMHFWAFFLRGVFKGRYEPHQSLWQLNHEPPIFREAMSRNILRYIRVDEKTSSTTRRKKDDFAAIRELWNTVNCQKSYFPHADVTVDE